MRFYKYALYSLALFIVLADCLAKAAPGDVVIQFPTPGSCPTGLAFDGKNLWLADRKTDSLYMIDPGDGNVVKALESPGFRVEGLTAEGDRLWVLDIEEGVALKLNPATGIVEKTIYVPCNSPQGLAWDGQYLWVADYQDDKIYRISTEDGTTMSEIKAPSGTPQGLAFDGKYLWVSDRFRDMIYMVTPDNGEVVMNFESPSKYPRGIAYDGRFLWNVDYQSDSLYKIVVDDTSLFRQFDGKKEILEYSHQVRNYGPGSLTDLDIYIALPRDLPFQKLLDTLVFNPPPDDYREDQWGQKVAHYHYRDIPAGEVVTVSMTARAELYRTRFYIHPDKVGNLNQIPADIKKLYLIDGSKYWVDDDYIKKTAESIVGDETNCYWIARRIFNYLIANMKYELAGGWNVAPTVLKRGNGSCSEYSFVYIALCRAAGLPARYAGSVVIRGDDASTDDVFHRWVEVYLPNYGWIPIDPSGGDSDSPANQASAIGYLDNRFLITTIGGGGSEFLEWNYNSNEIWQSRGPCKIVTEHIGEWSPLPDSSGN
nr:transglutaminase [candidate division Zixibacteria bacterium]